MLGEDQDRAGSEREHDQEPERQQSADPVRPGEDDEQQQDDEQRNAHVVVDPAAAEVVGQPYQRRYAEHLLRGGHDQPLKLQRESGLLPDQHRPLVMPERVDQVRGRRHHRDCVGDRGQQENGEEDDA